MDTDSSRAPDITSYFYGPMNVHRGAVISAIVTVDILFCILHFNALMTFLILSTQCKSWYCIDNKNVRYTLTPLYMYTLPYTCITPLRGFFFFALRFRAPHFSSHIYAIASRTCCRVAEYMADYSR